METQTWLNRHYKFISAENITISLSRQMTFYFFVYYVLLLYICMYFYNIQSPSKDADWIL